MSISKDALHEVTKLGSGKLLRHGRADAIRTAVDDMSDPSRVLRDLARRNGCTEGTARQQVGKAVRQFLNAKNTGKYRQANGYRYTVLG